MKRAQIPTTRWFVLVLLLCGVLLALLPSAGRAETIHHAGLVVRHADGEITYAYVSFSENEISGIELLKRSGIPIVTVGFGGLGEGVCSIERTGCPASDCRKRLCQAPGNESPFWQYFRQTSPGEWKPVALGASSTKVHDGDVDGWSWTPKQANLPPLTLDDIAEQVGAPLKEEATAGQIPTAIVRSGMTDVKPVGHDGQSVSTWIGGAIILVGLIGIAGVALYRARRVVKSL